MSPELASLGTRGGGVSVAFADPVGQTGIAWWYEGRFKLPAPVIIPLFARP